MYLRITEKYLIICAALSLMVTSLLPGFVPYVVSISLIRLGVASLVLAVCLFIRRFNYNWKIIPVILLLIIFCRNNYYFQIGNVMFTIFLMTIALMILTVMGNGEWIEMYLKGVTIMGLVHAFCTIIFRFTPSIYLGLIAPLYPSTYSRLVGWYAEGCMPGLAGHYTTNAVYLVIGLFASIGIFFIEENQQNWKRIVPIAVFFVALLLTGKRSHLFFSIIVIYFLYYCYLSNDKRTRAIRMIGVALLVAFAGLIIILYVPSLANAFTRMTESLEEGDVTNNRTHFWALALYLFKLNPALGVGWGQFLSYSESILNYKAHAHNNFLQLLCETGVIGFIVYVLWLIVNVVKAIRLFIQIRLNNIGGKYLGIIAFCVACQCFLILYCFTGNPLYEKETVIPYFFSCAMVWYLAKMRLKSGESNTK